MRSGRVNLPETNGTFGNAGINGNYWSSRGGAATTAYNLNFNESAVYPSNGPNNRFNGFSLRWASLPAAGADLFLCYNITVEINPWILKAAEFISPLAGSFLKKIVGFTLNIHEGYKG